MPRKLLAQITCPHCWSESRADELLWVATHPELRGDPKLGPDEGLRYPPTRFTPSGNAIDPLGGMSTEFACPQCHLTIPPILLERPLNIYSIAGAPGSGKSCYLASALREMRRIFAATFSLAVIDADPASSVALRCNEERLFMAEDASVPVTIAKTELAEGPYRTITPEPGVSVLLPRPFVLAVRPIGRHPNAQVAESCTHTICLYDNAGEHFLPGADSLAHPGTQHLARASILFFLFDPTQDARFRPILSALSSDPQLALPPRTERQEILIAEMAHRIRRHAGLSAGERLRRVLMVLVVKSDVWGKLVAEDIDSDPYWTTQMNDRMLGHVDTRRVDRVSSSVRAMLTRFAPEVTATAEDACDRVLYLPVSSFGTSPALDPATGALLVRPHDLRPRWVTVPFAYALSRWGTTLIGSNKSEDIQREPGADRAAAPVASGDGPRGA